MVVSTVWFWVSCTRWPMPSSGELNEVIRSQPTARSEKVTRPSRIVKSW